jgi:hypothetical protein
MSCSAIVVYQRFHLHGRRVNHARNPQEASNKLFPIMKMEAIHFSETSVNVYRSTRRYMPDERCEDLTSNKSRLVNLRAIRRRISHRRHSLPTLSRMQKCEQIEVGRRHLLNSASEASSSKLGLKTFSNFHELLQPNSRMSPQNSLCRFDIISAFIQYV